MRAAQEHGGECAQWDPLGFYRPAPYRGCQYFLADRSAFPCRSGLANTAALPIAFNEPRGLSYQRWRHVLTTDTEIVGRHESGPALGLKEFGGSIAISMRSAWLPIFGETDMTLSTPLL
jgi:hypothetical protein